MTDFEGLTAQIQRLLVENEDLREENLRLTSQLASAQSSRDRWAERAALLAGQKALVPPQSIEEEIASLPADSVAEKLREVWHAVLKIPATDARHPLEPAKSLPEPEEKPNDGS